MPSSSIATPVYDAKVVLVGPQDAGKTALFNRIIYDEANPTSMTLGAYFGSVAVGNKFSMSLWDTAGNDRFTALTPFYIKDAQLILLCMNPLSENFAAELVALRSLVNQYEVDSGNGTKFLLIATKKDLVTPADELILQQNLATFHKEFAHLPIGDHVLQVSAKDPRSRDNLLVALGEKLEACIKVQVKIDPKLQRIINRLNALETEMSKRFFKPDISRVQSIQRLSQALINAKSPADIKQVLIDEACFIRTPDANNKYRYGINLGSSRLKFFIHFRSYEDSSLYQFIKNELKRIDPALNLAEVSAPRPAIRQGLSL